MIPSYCLIDFDKVDRRKAATTFFPFFLFVFVAAVDGFCYAHLQSSSRHTALRHIIGTSKGSYTYICLHLHRSFDSDVAVSDILVFACVSALFPPFYSFNLDFYSFLLRVKCGGEGKKKGEHFF